MSKTRNTPPKGWDFSGYVTAYGVKCTDGATISKDSFMHQDGQTVALCYQHNKKSISDIIGKVWLENREKGMYGYAYLNDTDGAKDAKICVKHGDINNFSIYATHVTRTDKNVVTHGEITEVSLVLKGANPGATITEITHSDEYGLVCLFANPDGNAEIEINHADDDDPSDNASNDTSTEPGVDAPIEHKQKEDKNIADMSDDELTEHVDKVLNSFTPDQLMLYESGLMAAFEDGKKAGIEEQSAKEKKNVEHSDDPTTDDTEVNNTMSKWNIFSSKVNANGTVASNDKYTLSHADEVAMIKQLKTNQKYNTDNGVSLKEVICDYLNENTTTFAHADSEGNTLSHSVDGIDILFPDAKDAVEPFIGEGRNVDWVEGVISACHKTPYATFKSRYFNITMDEARARGYVTKVDGHTVRGKEKAEQEYKVLKRSTNPATIYIYSTLTNDELIDVDDFDIIRFQNSEMQRQLREEIARAILISDGRSVSSEDKIDEEKVRPIWKDDDVYVKRYTLGTTAGDLTETGEFDPMKYEDQCIRLRTHIKAPGKPTLYMQQKYASEVLLMRDKINRPFYQTLEAFAARINVEKIVTPEVFDNAVRTVTVDNTTKELELVSIMVNLANYNLGSNRGGKISDHRDFILKKNLHEFLVEARVSGGLIYPKAAVVIEIEHKDETVESDEPADNGETPAKPTPEAEG